MEKGTFYNGVNFNNLRKALYLIIFGIDNGKCNAFSSEKYKYIIPIQGVFENPLKGEDAKDTFVLFWIEQDKSLTQDDYIQDGDKAFNRQKCVANVLLRFVGRNAEQWVRIFRHLTKRDIVGSIFYGVCNAEKLEYTSPIIPRRVDYFGKTSQIAFDIRFKLYYDERIDIKWNKLEGIEIKIEGTIQ